ncbi:hypothetical protein EW145_g6597 [Phellinidium pouzarii]|uniref:Carrier domain-containing protein n=1 Tax=Phellinidium pouzarii TaxID=167371 RepID=A0A4S4KW83_9AGAM|nr:hypothetical protein EW145_g6597 [Phellinidium pouzarii]
MPDNFSNFQQCSNSHVPVLDWNIQGHRILIIEHLILHTNCSRPSDHHQKATFLGPLCLLPTVIKHKLGGSYHLIKGVEYEEQLRDTTEGPFVAAEMSPPQCHGLHSSTFVQPPLDFSLSLPALFDWQAEHSPEHPLFIFEDAPDSKRTILWAEAVQGIHRATQFVRSAIGKPFGSRSINISPLIAVLASSDTITSFSFLVGVMRTGWTIFPISPRNSPPAVAALLTQTKATHLFISSEPAIQNLADSALKQIDADTVIELHQMPVFEDLFPTKGYDPSFAPVPLVNIDMDSHAMILHSSGTTAFPKPVYFTPKDLVDNVSFVCYGETDLAGSIFACHGVPMFHGMGMIIVMFSVSCGFVAAVFKPQSPAVIPNPVNVIESAIALKCDYAFVSPIFPESWSHDSNYVKALANMKGVIYGGGPISKEAGDALSSEGVNLFAIYASTQALGVSVFLPEPPGKDWEYFRVPSVRETHFEDHGNNEYEIILIASGTFRPTNINTTVNGREAYATSDLLSPHPTKKGYWKVIGRTDDQIMHSTGEKTNPGPLEAMLCRDSLVHGAIMFGRSRFHCGVLVQPKIPFSFDPVDTKKVIEFRNLIWPTIENINAYAPTHSRIFKEMILITSPSKPLLYTPKGTIRRRPILDQYTAEIDAIYAAVDESAQDEISGPKDWSISNVIKFVRQVVEKTMKNNRQISDDKDLFEFGLDSLQATWIRNTLLRVLRETNPAVARKFSPTFVYDHPTIIGLANYIAAGVTGASVALPGSIQDKRRELQSLVSKYTTTFPEFRAAPTGTRVETVGDVVLLTGSTGSLGSNILAKLIQNVGIVHVYAMSRPSSDGTSSKERHKKAFAREGLDMSLLDGSKVRFLSGDPSHANFVVEPDLFNEMQSSVTHIIHNAWRVNFNVAVTSFESNIRSVRNFVDFSLGGHSTKPARIIFISSMGVFQNYKGNNPAVEEPLVQPDSAVGTGYAESKWVSEQVLEKASERTPLSTTVVRCGQMTGGPSGAWNDHEWFPSLVKSSIALGKAPHVEGTVSWITAYDAAAAVVDMLHADSERIVHLVHPRPVAWSAIITVFAREMDLPIVPYRDWVTALEHAYSALYAGTPDAEKVEKALRESPALRLLLFFSSALKREGDDNIEPLGIAKLSCERAVSSSQILRDTGCIMDENVERWIANWKKTGFI